MNRKNHFLALFYPNLVTLFVGYGLFPLLPLYAMRYGASASSIGVYLAIINLAITFGTLLPGWLPARFSQKRLLLVASAAGAPALALMGQASALWQVILLTSIVWFSGGTILAIITVLTGLSSEQGQAGRAFSLLALAAPIASLLGGLAVGALVDAAGYAPMFVLLGFFWATIPLAAALRLTDVRAEPTPESAAAGSESASAHRAFLLLAGATLLAAGAASIGSMGTSLSMETLAFSPAAISSTAAVSGLVLIPIVLLISAISDRQEGHGLLVLGHLFAGMGMVTLVLASALWHFWLATTLLMVGRTISDALGPAAATRLLPPAALGSALPRLRSMNFIAGIAAFAGAGYALDTLGMMPVFLGAAGFAMVAAGMMASQPVGQALAGTCVTVPNPAGARPVSICWPAPAPGTVGDARRDVHGTAIFYPVTSESETAIGR